MPDRLVIAEIDLNAYQRNLQVLRSLIPEKTMLMAIVKANAYGHGITEMAKMAQRSRVDYIGVVSLGEARQLRRVGVTLPILIINYIDTESALEASALGCELTVMDGGMIEALGQSNKKIVLHLKVDTGMHRAGANPIEVLDLVEKIHKFPNLDLKGIFTHFADADNENLSFTREQLRLFNEVLHLLEEKNLLPPIIHSANSAATLCLPESHFSMIRPGIASYGLSPFDSSHPLYKQFRKDFHPILSLHTQVVRVHTIHSGDTVGYGRTFIARRDMQVALLPVGYGDGFRRAPNNWNKVLIRGLRAPILGRVSMDQTTVDVSALSNVQIGEDVVLLGKQGEIEISAEAIAKTIGTINYEVVTGLTSRVERVYKGGL